MPRTKRPTARKPTKQNEGQLNLQKQLHTLLEMEKKALDLKLENECKQIDFAYTILVNSLGNEFLQKTIYELQQELIVNTDPSFHSANSGCLSAQDKDDGYLTESSHGSLQQSQKKTFARSTACSSSRTTQDSGVKVSSVSRAGWGGRRRSRSADVRDVRDVRGRSVARKLPPSSASRYMSHRRSRSVYCTPVMQRLAPSQLPPVTPKVAPDTPLTLVRHPRNGEMAISMSGSPLIVAPMQTDGQATCDIPLHDGTVLSMRPRQLRNSSTYIPIQLMGPATLQQLETIKQNLDTILKLSHKSAK